MSKEESKEYAESLKLGTKELLDCIGTDTAFEQRIIKIIYAFVRQGFLEIRAEKGGAV